MVDIDATLRRNDGRNLATTATPVEVVLDGDGQTPSKGAMGGALVEASDPETKVSVGLGFEGDLAAPVVEGESATYAQRGADSREGAEDAGGAAAVRVSAGNNGFTTHVVLDEQPADLEESGPVYRFPLRVEGAKARLVGGSLEFVDPQGTVVAESSLLRMWDAQVDEWGEPTNVVAVDSKLVQAGSGQVLELRPDPAFLTAEDTVYPVTVDPNITLMPDTATYITSEDPGSAFGGEWNLRVGSNNGTDRYQSYLDFQINSEVGRTITDAKLNLFQYAAGNCNNRQVYAQMATSDWLPQAAVPGTQAMRSWKRRGTLAGQDSRFASQASFNAGGASSDPNCSQTGWQEIDLTPQATAWSTLAATNFGVRLRVPGGQETNPNYEKRFCSNKKNTSSGGYCRWTNQNQTPTMEFTYTPQIGDQSWYSTSKHSQGERSTLKVNHHSGNVYLEDKDVKVSSLGGDFMLGRRYNSRAETTGQFGSKWTMSGGPDVWLEKLDEWRYVYHAPDGAELGPFTREADSPGNNYRKFHTPIGGVGADLKDNNDDTFTLTFHQSQKKYVFDQIGPDGHLYQIEQKDRSGNTTTYDYVSGTTRLDTVTDTADRTYQITYGTGATADLVTGISESNGPTTRTWDYDYTSGRLTGYTDPEGETTTYDWADGGGSAGQVIGTITDPVNDSGQAPVTTLVTAHGETVQAIYADNTGGADSSYSFTYQDNPQNLATCDNGTDRSSQVTSAELDTGITTYCFNERENDPDIDNNDNNATTTVYDGKGDTRSNSYSPDNQPEVMTDDSGATTVNTYGDSGSGLADRLEKSTQPKNGSNDQASTNYVYKAPNSVQGDDYLPASMVDGSGDCTAYGYDPTGRLTDTWLARDPNNGRCDNQSGGLRYQASYNNDGTVAWMSDPNSDNDGSSPTTAQKTLYTYWAPGDAGFVAGTKGQVKSMRRPGGDCATGDARELCTSYTYDGLSRTLTEVDGRGETTRSTYDVMDRTTESLSSGATTCQPAQGTCITYDYDTAGNMTERSDQQGTTTFDYDRMHRRTGQTTPDGAVVGYGYNRDSRLARLEQTIPGVPTDEVTYNYDNAGQVNAVVDATGTINISHDSNQRLKQIQYPTTPTATFTSWTYTSSGQPKVIDTYSGTSTYDGMTKYAYTWSENGDDTNQLQKVKVTQSPSSVTYDADFSYNNRGQLTGETRSNGGGRDYSFTYDNAGNLTRADRGNTTTYFGYDQANQLCWMGPTDGTNLVSSCPGTAPGASRVVARDAAGNSEGDPENPIDYNPRSQATSIDGQDQGYLDQGNDLRTTAGDTRLVNTQTGITARTTNTGTTEAQTTFYTRMPDGRILSAHRPGAGDAGTVFYVTDDLNRHEFDAASL